MNVSDVMTAPRVPPVLLAFCLESAVVVDTLLVAGILETMLRINKMGADIEYLFRGMEDRCI